MSLTHTKPNLLKSKNPKLIFAAQLYKHMKTWEILRVSPHVEQDLQTAISTFKEKEFKVCFQWYLDLFYTTHAQLNHKFPTECVPLLHWLNNIFFLWICETLIRSAEWLVLWKRKKHVRQNPSRLNKHYCVYIIIYISLARKGKVDLRDYFETVLLEGTKYLEHNYGKISVHTQWASFHVYAHILFLMHL